MPFDLTPYTEAIAKARQTKDSDDVAIEFTAEITSPPTAGIVEVSATVEDVNAPSIGDYVWDILLVRSDGGIDGPFLHGVITLENSASR